MTKRLLTMALAAVVFASIPTGSKAPAYADEGFEFMYFPHQGLDVEFSNDWGAPRDGGARSHRGTDIFSPKLTPIVAVADGFITRIGESKRPGQQLRMRHANGWESWYFHLNNDNPGTDDNRAGGGALTFAEGIEEEMFVTAGTVIAYVGDSGNAEHTQPHTHFELHHNGTALNPYPYLRAAWARQKRVHELFDSLELD